MAVGNYTIYVRNASLQLVGQLDLFSQLDFVLRFNGWGTFALEIGADNPQALNLTTIGNGIIIQRNNVTLFSGPIRRIEYRGVASNTVMISGVDDLFWLTGRQAWPVVTDVPGNVSRFAASAYDTRTGVGETIIKQYVDYNGGPHAISYRQIPGLSIETDAARGSSVTASARFDELVTAKNDGLLQQLAIAGGLGFRVVQIGTALQFQVYVPTDRTNAVKFSREFGNLADYTYVIDASAVENYVLTAGGGQGTARTFSEGSDATSIATYGRFEQFVDQRQTSDATQLAQAVTANLLAGKQQLNFNGTLAETKAIQYQTDFNLGDKVSVIVGGNQLTEVIRELHITLDTTAGETVTPVIGTPDAAQIMAAFSGISQALQQLLVRVNRLERTQ